MSTDKPKRKNTLWDIKIERTEAVEARAGWHARRGGGSARHAKHVSVTKLPVSHVVTLTAGKQSSAGHGAVVCICNGVGIFGIGGGAGHQQACQ
jgi:hypothetical protein